MSSEASSSSSVPWGRARGDTMGSTGTSYTGYSATSSTLNRPSSSGATTMATHTSSSEDTPLIENNDNHEDTAIQNPKIQNLVSNPTIAKRWNEKLEVQTRRLKKQKYQERLRNELTYDDFKVALEEAVRKNSESRVTRYTEKLLPALQTFNNLSPVIANLFQQVSAAHLHPIAGFFWGMLQVVFVLASRYGSLLETISIMIEQLTVTLNNIAEYTNLLKPSSDSELSSCIDILISDYVGFCIHAYKFFIRYSPLHAIIRMFWSIIDSRFKEAKANIDRHFEYYNLARQAGVDRLVIEGVEKLDIKVEALSKAPQPPVESEHAQPKEFYDVPFTRDEKYFSCRDKTLEDLHNNLMEDRDQESSLRTCVIHGLGGVGKTHVAVEYTFRYRKEYQYIFWIQAETTLELQAGVERIVANLRLAREGIRNPTDAFRYWLENTKPEEKWLLVFDNAEHWKTLRTCWPSSTRGHGSIILTAQNPEFVHVTKGEIALKPFDDNEGAELLLKYLRDVSEEEKKNAESISNEVGGLPLAIAHIAGYISGSKITNLGEFLEGFSKRFTSASWLYDMVEHPLTLTHYHKRLGVVWDVALERVATDPDALQLLQILAMMNPNGVPEDMIYGDHEAECLEFLTPKKDKGKNRFNKMILLLRTSALVNRETISGIPCLSMHRALQQSILHRLDLDENNTFQKIFDMAFTLIRQKFPKQSPIHAPQSESWKDFELYRPHVMNLHRVYVRSHVRPRVDVGLAELLSDAGYFFYDRGIFLEGITASDTAEEIISEYPVEDQDLVLHANICTVAGVVRWDRGMPTRKKMLQCFLKCLSLRQQHINRNQMSVNQAEIILYANAWNDVGMIIAEFECYEDAIACAELSSQIRRKAGDPWSWLQSEKLKAQALSGLGRHKDAVACIVEDNKLPEEIVSPTSIIASGSYPQQLQYMYANILLNAGELDLARRIFLTVLERRRDLFGEMARDTLSAQYMLAVIEQKKKNLDGAVQLLREILKKSANWSDVLVARAQNRLAQILQELKENDEATYLRFLAEKTLKKVWKEYSYYIPANAQPTDEQVYDHISPLECGRTTPGGFQQIGKFPGLMKICQTLRQRFSEKGDVPVDPCDVAEICKLDDINIPETEGFF